MATIDKTFLDLAGLTTYDTAIKNWGNSASQLGFKTVLASTDGNNIYFYKKPNAVLGTDTPDATIALTSSGADKKVWLTDNTSTSGTNYAKIYKLYQGANAPDAATDPATLIGTINIPKDMVVSAGVVVDVVFDSSDNTLHEGTISGTDVTEEILGTGATATAADAGKYIKLTIANATASHLWIKATDLVDVYTGGTTTEVTVSVNSSTNVITATIGSIDGAKVVYKAETSAGAGDGESVKAALTRLDGDNTTTGSVAKKVKDAIDALDTSSDVAVSNYTAGTGTGQAKTADVITLTGSIKEENGVIATGTADTITLSTITNAQISALFTP